MKWFTGDLHLDHKNIIVGLSKWASGATREFDSVEHMNDTIISNINSLVKPTDELYILGDIYMGRDENRLIEFLDRINGLKYLTPGNHDYVITPAVKERFIDVDKIMDVRMKYPLPTDGPKDKWHGRAHLVLAHYAFRVWNKSHRNSYMLYGHSHGKLDKLNNPEISDMANAINEYYTGFKTMDVGIDNIFNLTGEYKPISFQEIDDIMNSRKTLKVDGH